MNYLIIYTDKEDGRTFAENVTATNFASAFRIAQKIAGENYKIKGINETH